MARAMDMDLVMEEVTVDMVRVMVDMVSAIEVMEAAGDMARAGIMEVVVMGKDMVDTNMENKVRQCPLL